MTIHDYLQEWAAEVEKTLDEVLPATGRQPSSIHEAMRYSCMGGGKRLRAVMALAACRAVGGAERDALGYGAALEMLHAYSLIHDDLPAMDDDDYRRGKLANHKVYGEAMAVLAGDALLTHAMEQLAALPEFYPVTLITAYRLMHEVTRACGTQGLIGGQVMDLENTGLPADAATLEAIHRRKTGALFEVSLKGGAMIGGGKNNELAALTRYAENFGLAFQITDDLLDVVGNQEALGKETGADARKNKATYPGVHGLERSRQMAADCLDACQASLSFLSGETWPLQQLAASILERDH